MRAWEKLRLRLRSLFRRGHVEQELDAEVEFHLDQLVEEKIHSGVAPEEAQVGAYRNGSYDPVSGGMPRYATRELH
jgi:hypothetical protein